MGYELTQQNQETAAHSCVYAVYKIFNASLSILYGVLYKPRNVLLWSTLYGVLIEISFFLIHGISGVTDYTGNVHA